MQRGARGAEQRIAKAGKRQRARPPRQKQRQEHADHRRFGRRGEPAIDRADDAEDQQRHRDQPARRLDARGERHRRLGRRHAFLVEQRPDDDEAHEQPGQHDARDHAGDEQPRDRLLGDGGVDDQDDRGRDQQAERAGAGQRADRHLFVVAALQQFGQRDAADRCAGGGGGAGHRGKDRAADHVDMQQPAGQFLQPRRQPLEHVVGQFGAVEDLAHPDEHRQSGEVPGIRRRPYRGGEHLPGRRCHFGHHRGKAADRERQRDPHAGAEHREQQQHEDERKFDDVHGCAHRACSWSDLATAGDIGLAFLAQGDRVFRRAEARPAGDDHDARARR